MMVIPEAAGGPRRSADLGWGRATVSAPMSVCSKTRIAPRQGSQTLVGSYSLAISGGGGTQLGSVHSGSLIQYRGGGSLCPRPATSLGIPSSANVGVESRHSGRVFFSGVESASEPGVDNWVCEKVGVVAVHETERQCFTHLSSRIPRRPLCLTHPRPRPFFPRTGPRPQFTRCLPRQ